MIPVFDDLDLRNADSVIRALADGTHANLEARCRRGSIDVIGPFAQEDPGAYLIATGDLHDNPLHLARVITAANLATAPTDGERTPRFHLTLHELIHADNIANQTDFSFRVLTRAAALKALFPEHVHLLLANHELAQRMNAEVMKEGVRCVQAFNNGVDQAFGPRADDVTEAINEFIASMPLALRVLMPGEGTDILCAHSLPAPELMDRFDPSIIHRDFRAADYEARKGSAHLMVWGRGHTPEQLISLGKTWDVGLFLLGHEKAERGTEIVPPCAVIINSDHAKGVYIRLKINEICNAQQAVSQAKTLG